MEIDSKRIVLTGAASGIGKALLERLATYNAQILAVDLDRARLESVVAAIANPRASINIYGCDVGQQASIDELFTYALNNMSSIDVFIANAGFAYYEKLEVSDWAHIDGIYRVNVFSPIYTAEKMQALNGDQAYCMVMTASAMGELALPGYALYSSTKGALDRFADAYRYELGKNALLTIVYPIATRTQFFRQAADDTPVPFPSQTPEYVAGAIITGIERNQRAIYPSYLYRLLRFFNPVFPFLGKMYQLIELQNFHRWLKGKNVHR